MDLLEHLAQARAAKAAKTKERRATQIFTFDWRSAGSEIVVGWAAAAKRLHMKETTLAVRLSEHGNAFHVKAVNPLTNEPDILTVSKVSAAKAEAARRGRKPKVLDLDLLGSEALCDMRHAKRRRRK